MGAKKTEQIGIRVTPETKKALETEAKKLEWSTAKLAEKILTDWTQRITTDGGAINFIIQKNETININK